ncbi:SCO4848 family membrane protein [Microbacterium sp. RD1]|uniref:SCO4848 family membrane protein n=1 Tax=Microbacterium sp. RD1 TaxID=3457313 RepID=UPI003FA5EB50
METLLAVLLLVNAAFNVVVWPRFFGRIAKDPRARDAAGKPTRFLIVHAVLIGLALVLALVSAVAGVWALIA